MLLDVTEQKWEIYPVILDNYMTPFGKLIALRDNLYYFYEFSSPYLADINGDINLRDHPLMMSDDF